MTTRALLIVAFLACSSAAETRIEQLWHDAAAAQRAERFSHAATLYREILSLRPNWTEAEVNLGLMYQLSGDRRAAIACFQKVLEKAPDLYAPNLMTGLDYLKAGNPDLALPYLERATAVKPGENQARVGLANSYLQLHRYSDAQRQFSRATEIDDKNAEGWYGLGVTYLSLEKQAEQEIRHSSSPYRLVLLGDSYLRQGRPADAIRVLESVVEATSDVPFAHSLLALAYVRVGKLDEAARQSHTDWNAQSRAGCPLGKLGLPTESMPLSTQQLRTVARCSYYAGRDDLVLNATGLLLKADATEPEALYWRIESLERLGLASLTKATSLNPDSVSLHVLFGEMLRAKGDFSGAAEEYQEAISLKPEFLAAHLGLARTFYWDNKREQAEHELRYVLNANPADPEASYLMGEILVNRHEFTGALPFLLAGLRAEPEELPHVHAALSKVYDNRGETPRAIAELRQALPADGDGSYYYRLSRLYVKAGNPTAAAEALKQSARLRVKSDSAASFDVN